MKAVGELTKIIISLKTSGAVKLDTETLLFTGKMRPRMRVEKSAIYRR